MEGIVNDYFQKVKEMAGLKGAVFTYPKGEESLAEMVKTFGEKAVSEAIESMSSGISKSPSMKKLDNNWARFNYVISSIKNKIAQNYIAELMGAEAKTYNQGDAYEVDNVKQQSRSNISKWLDDKEGEC